MATSTIKRHKPSHPLRFLTSPISGTVVPIGELPHDEFAKRTAGDGFAVYPFSNRINKLFGIIPFYKQRMISVYSPTDAVVTTIEDGVIYLRTGDGISIAILLHEQALFFAKEGRRIHRGSRLAAFHRDSTERLPCGAIPVLFPEPIQISELHVFSRRCLSGAISATYKANRTE